MNTARLMIEPASVTRSALDISSTDLMPGWTAKTIFELASRVDCDFQTAGSTLEQVLSTFDGIVSQLDRLAAPAEIQGAGETLDHHVAMLNALPDRHAAQLALLDQARDIYRALNRSLSEIRRIVLVLGIYGVNVKIVATSNDVDSFDLIHTMTDRLEQGGANVDRFARHFEQLHRALGEIFELADELASRLEQCIPTVPDQLVDARQALDLHRRALSDTGQQMADLMNGMKRHVMTALVAVQIGDLTRQRLEHVGTGITLFESYQARHGANAEARLHMSNLLRSLVDSARVSFAAETQTLNTAFSAIGPCARQLQALRGQGAAGAGGQHILARLEGSVKAGQSMVDALREAEVMMAQLTRLFPEIVRGVSQNVDALNDLRRDVQQLSINIGLRYRDNSGSGKAARILAGEIHVHSRSLETESRHIGNHLARLDALAEQIAGQSRPDGTDGGSSLVNVAAAIRQGAETQERDARDAAAAIGRLLRSVDEVGVLLARQDDVTRALGRVSGGAETETVLPDWYRDEFLPQFYAIYTMADERTVHRLHCAHATGTPVIEEAAAASSGDDFDDFTLF